MLRRETMLGPERARAWRFVMSSSVNIASTPSPISLSTSPPSSWMASMAGLRVVVEERNDLVGPDGFADRGRAAQIGKPQHGVDALGHAPARCGGPRSTCSEASRPRIDPAQRAGPMSDLGGGTLDREPPTPAPGRAAPTSPAR